MIYNGVLLVGVDNNAKIEKLYSLVYKKNDSHKVKYGGRCFETVEAALNEARETDVDFDEVAVYENIIADKTVVFVSVIKYAYKSEAEAKKWRQGI
jgi:hypothetical protein